MVIIEQFWVLLGLNKKARILLSLVPNYQDFCVSYPKPLFFFLPKKSPIRAKIDLSTSEHLFSTLKSFKNKTIYE